MDDISDTNSKENTATSVFKVPIISSPKINKDSKKKSEGRSEASNDQIQPKDESLPSKNNRPSISFRPKSFALPSEIYKPHRPSTSEFLERHIKKKQAKQQSTNSATPDKPSNTPPDASCESENSNGNQKSMKVELTDKARQAISKSRKPTESKLKYTVPNWSCKMECLLNNHRPAYYIEVLKNGTIIDKIELVNREKEFYSFGRLAECDLMMEHPSISR